MTANTDKGNIVKSNEHPTWPARGVREEFLNFFRERQHEIVESSPVVPKDDPTLLFANAGMNQFKPIFLGQADPSSKLGNLKRAADTQKCIRAGGKHNDLDDVGKDTYHHTFFEMLGNWSFGDYFKREAIHWAFELLTARFHLDPARLYATYFQGDESQGVPPDTEARDIWRELLPEGKILPFDAKDNFWEMGDTGPCGPCTEIHYDRKGGRDASDLVNQDDPEVMEVWNLVFIQFNREKDGTLKPLPSKHVDTGMGFERMVAILQGKESNYDTDVFQPLFAAIQQATGAPPYQGLMGEEDRKQNSRDMAYRVVADHIRALSFAIADGAAPGNEGRDYVLRRILRRAIRYGRDCLGGPVGFLSGLLDTLQACMGDVFPELVQQGERIRHELRSEEKNFEQTIMRGVEQFKRAVANAQPGRDGTPVLPGKDAFTLWDTFGFPLDLTELMCQERGLELDKDGFEREMEKQRERSRAAAKTAAAASIPFEADQTNGLSERDIPRTDDTLKYTWWEPQTGTVKALLGTDGCFKDEVSEVDGIVGVVLDRTSFYAEQGGQIYDVGTIESHDGKVNVQDVQVAAGYVLHVGSPEGRIAEGETVTCMVDYTRRSFIAPNHTMTHMLNFALRKFLGDSVDQKGSLVDPQKLRFDFSCDSPPDAGKIEEIESFVNECIRDSMPVYSKEVALEKAFQINGLRAVFGEVYPDPVRVLTVGKPVESMLEDPGSDKCRDYSVEFCGGTHLSNTGQAEEFAIVQEEAISKGVRRLTAYTRDAARAAFRNAEEIERKLNEAQMCDDEQTLERKVHEARQELTNKELPYAWKHKLKSQADSCTKRLLDFQKQRANQNKEQVRSIASQKCEEAESGSLRHVELHLPDGLDAKALQEATTTCQKRGIACAAFSIDPGKGKVACSVAVPQALWQEVEPKEWLMAALAPVQGKGGGGKNGLAHGQGSDPSAVSDAVQAAQEFAHRCLHP